MDTRIRADFQVHSLAAMKMKRGKAPKPPEFAVETRRAVHPAIWAAALEQAGGKASRIRILSYSEVQII